MEPFSIGMAGLGLAGLSTLGAFGLALRQRRRRLRASASAAGIAAGMGETEAGTPRTLADRVEALYQSQARMAQRIDALSEEAHAPEARLQAVAGQLLGLVRDKNATLETALAGLDQLRARLVTLEQIGEPAEARALLKTLEGRLEALAQNQSADAARLEARIDSRMEAHVAVRESGEALGARLTELEAAFRAELKAGREAGRETGRAAALEAVLERLAPLEKRLAALEGLQESLGRLETRLEGRVDALGGEQGTLRGMLAALEERTTGREQTLGEQERLSERLATRLDTLEAEIAGRDPAAALERFAERLEAMQARVGVLETAENPFGEISEQLTRLYAQKDATVETVFARLAPLEAKLDTLEAEIAGRDPAAALERFAERLEAVQARVGVLETAENPFGEISEQLTRLYAQKDATVETVFARLAPLEAKLDTLEAEIAGRDPAAALERFAERLEAMQARVGVLETAENPFGEISEQLTRLYAQKDATVETVFARLAPLEAKLDTLEAEIAGRDPAAALERFAERLEAVQARVGVLETAENPFGEISEQLTRLYAQKDATVETVFARLAPLEAKLDTLEAEIAGRDPAAALERFAERLEAMQARVGVLETAENPFGEISEQLTRLYAQKDATVETVFARLAPLEAKLDTLEAEIAGRDPAAALERFAERLEAVQARVGVLETAENPFGEISEQLTRLYAQKDATVETVFARLAPLEAKLDTLEAEIAGRDPAAALERFAERLEAMQARVGVLETAENPFGEISEQLTRLYAQKDATVETVFARLAPLEAKLDTLEAEIAGRDPAAALERFAERLEAMQARVGVLETAENPFGEISEQLTRLYAQKDATVETVFARLAPLEAKLDTLEAEIAGRDPAAALERFAERLEAVQARVGVLETAENPFGEISEQLTRLYAQKDATVETVFARLAPLEAKLDTLEAEIAGRDPAAALERFAERLEAVQARVGVLETAENPFGEISEQLTRLYAQKDATVETVFARLAPLEAKLAEMERGLVPLLEDDPRAGLDGLRARIEALQWGQGETAAGLAALRAAAEARGQEGGALSDITDRLTRLFAQKDASIAQVLARVDTLEERLESAGTRTCDPETETARAEARARAQVAAAQMIAARAASDVTAIFADRITELEAALPRRAMPAVEGSKESGAAQAAAAPTGSSPATGGPAASRAAEDRSGENRAGDVSPAPRPAAAAELEAIWTLPRIVSLHRT